MFFLCPESTHSTWSVSIWKNFFHKAWTSLPSCHTEHDFPGIWTRKYEVFTARGQKLALRRFLVSCVCQIHQNKVKPVWNKPAALWTPGPTYPPLWTLITHLVEMPADTKGHHSLNPDITHCRAEFTSYLWHSMFKLWWRHTHIQAPTHTHTHTYTHTQTHTCTRR